MSGFSLVEVLISTLLTAVTLAAVMTVTNSARDAFDMQPEATDLQQRLRVGVSALQAELTMAGAGIVSPGASGPLVRYLPPVMPYRSGLTRADVPGSFRADVVSLVYVPPRGAQTTVLGARVDAGGNHVLDTRADCGGVRTTRQCGFEEGMRVVVLQSDGRWDRGVVSQVFDEALHLRDVGALSSTYAGGDAVVAEVATHTYYLRPDPAERSGQLMHYDGSLTDMPVVDHVVGLEFQYFDEERTRLDASALTDGPWLPDDVHAGRFDADLLRIRRVRVIVRVQAAAAWFRGPASRLFTNGGTAVAPRYVPDREIMFDVSPPNMNAAINAAR